MKARRQAWKVCSKPGCPQLVSPSEPCPTHGRPLNQPWSNDRDRKAQHAFRNSTLARDGYTCQRCGHRDPTGKTLQAHHVSTTQGLTLCTKAANGCHAAVDAHAR